MFISLASHPFLGLVYRGSGIVRGYLNPLNELLGFLPLKAFSRGNNSKVVSLVLLVYIA